jgi:hypothetical protein
MQRINEIAKEKGLRIAEKTNDEMMIYYRPNITLCEGCGQEFISARPHAKTCGATCRKRLSRYNKSIAK